MEDHFEAFVDAAPPAGEASVPRSPTSVLAHRQISLAETLDRVLNKGVLLVGEITLSVADIDLLYLGLNVVLTSVDTMQRVRQEVVDGHSAHRV